MLFKTLFSCVLPFVLFFFFFGGVSAWPSGPFFLQLNDTEYVIGNDIWNITIGPTFGTKLYYKGKDIVGNAVGHYSSYSMLCSVNPTAETLTLAFRRSVKFELDFGKHLYSDTGVPRRRVRSERGRLALGYLSRTGWSIPVFREQGFTRSGMLNTASGLEYSLQRRALKTSLRSA
jgi:hypothetical protein